jgi:vang-like
VTLSTRQVLLGIGIWAIFMRKPIASLPRIFLFRAIIIFLVFITLFSYWLFYIVQVTESIAKAIVDGTEAANYKTLVSYAINLIDTLLFIHYVAVILLEVRHLHPTYYVKVVRSPDGEARNYAIGNFSIQRASVWILQKYYADFKIYNPYLERIPISKQQRKAISSSFKVYDVDSTSIPSSQHQSQRAVLAANARRRDSSHNERFYEEHEYDRRVKKRRARLITAAEEAFTHIKRVHDQNTLNTLDSYEAAASIFPSLARALQKYLRITRQQPRHSVDSILKHLSHCLKNDLSPRAFLETYINENPVLQSEKERGHSQSWSLICDELLSRPIYDNLSFQLVQGEVSLAVTIHKFPYFNVTEKVVDPKCNKFVLRLNSETSV